MSNCIKKKYDESPLDHDLIDSVTCGPDNNQSHDARNQRIRELNQDIIELNEMALMINQIILGQDEQIHNIEKNVQEIGSKIQGTCIELDHVNKQKKLGNRIKYAASGTLCLIASAPLGICGGPIPGICMVLASGMFGALALKKS